MILSPRWNFQTSAILLIFFSNKILMFLDMILHFWSTLKYHVILFCRHDDPDPTRINTENKCYCLQDEGFKCLPSGAMYIEPCKRADQAPVARFHVSGTRWYTFETFNFETVTFIFSIVPCWSWVIMLTKKIRWYLLSFNNISTLVMLYHMQNDS